MKRNYLLFMAVVCCLSTTARGAVTMSFGNTQPTTDTFDQYNFLDPATIPGTSPFAYNSQAFSDNGGPPGQTFTTPSIAMTFPLASISLKGASTGGANFGGGVFTAGTTWGVRISSVFGGTTLLPLLTVTNVATTVGADGTNWYKWSFTGADALTLLPATTYAFEVFSSLGYLGFDATTNSGLYSGGVAFNSTGGTRQFNSNTLQDRGYDRTFHVDLVPEPGSLMLALGGGGLLIGLGLRRLRR